MALPRSAQLRDCHRGTTWRKKHKTDILGPYSRCIGWVEVGRLVLLLRHWDPLTKARRPSFMFRFQGTTPKWRGSIESASYTLLLPSEGGMTTNQRAAKRWSNLQAELKHCVPWSVESPSWACELSWVPVSSAPQGSTKHCHATFLGQGTESKGG